MVVIAQISLCMVGNKRERVLGRAGRAVNAAARDFAREAAQLENGGVALTIVNTNSQQKCCET